MKKELKLYKELFSQVKERIRTAQTRAVLAVNNELIRLYWEVGKMLEERQKQQGWGAGIIPKLSKDIRNEIPEIQGFSERNIGRMIRFSREYPQLGAILPPVVAKLGDTAILPPPVAKLKKGKHEQMALQQLVVKIPWIHNVILMEKVKNEGERMWYIQQTISNGWSRNVLNQMIENKAHKRQGKLVNNFDLRLPSPQSDLVQQALKDPYIFDFLTLEKPYHELELEKELIKHLEKFLLELGQGFAFVGRQYYMKIGPKDYSIDLLFYHLRLRCFIVIDLKTVAFKPEFVGKMNFYCNSIDDLLKHEMDQPTIGLIICREKDHVIAEYSLRGMNKPIGVSEYTLTKALPKKLKSALPTIEEIEAEMSQNLRPPLNPSVKKKAKKKTIKKSARRK